jgi:hypothetical protein
MSTLRDIQENLQAYMLKNDVTALNDISDKKEQAVDRLDIYRYGYYLRLLEVSGKDFPCLKSVTGDELFEKIGREYINKFPSNHFSICYFDRFFSSYLSEAGYEPYLAEIALFEWSLNRAIDAPDANIATFAQLTQIPPEQWPYLQFTLHPSVQCFVFEYNAPEVCHSLMLGNEAPSCIKYEQPTHWMIWRANHNAYYESCDITRLFIFNAIKQNKSFSEICEGLCEWLNEDEIPGYALGILRYWLDKEIIATISVQEGATMCAGQPAEEAELA